MDQKIVKLKAKLAGTLYELLVNTRIDNVHMLDGTLLIDKLQEIVNAINAREKIVDVDRKIDAAKTDIETKANSYTDQHITSALEDIEAATNKEVNQLRSDLNDLSNMKSGAIIQTASGESIVTNDSIDDSLRGLRVFGKTKQFSTSGKNLLVVTATSTTVSGVTFNVNADKSITVNGTATGEITYNISVLLRLTIGESYCLSGCPSGGSDTTYRMNAVNPDTWSGNIFDTGTGTTFPAQYSDYNIRIQIKTGVTLSNLTFKPMIRLASIADGTYEPYTGGIPSPNPQYPQELVSVGDDGDIEVGVYGKNLASSVFSNNGSSSAYGRCLFAEVEALKPNTEYTISFVGAKGHLIYSNEVNFDKITNLHCTGERQYITVKTLPVLNKDNGGAYIENQGWVLFENQGGNTVAPDFKDVQIELGTVATTYEPYKAKQPLPISTPNGLPAVPVTDAYLATYTDENGQMWCADEIDFERGVYVKRIYEHEFSGTESFESHHSDRLYYYIQNDFVPIYGLCTIGICEADKTRFGGTGFYFVKTDTYSTVDELKAYLKEKYENGNPVKILGILKTPIETPLSEEELTAYRALHSNYPVTTVLNDSGANMEVKYNADTKLYIDNKFAELQTALVALGGI